jgi:hypothetical protein
MRNLPNGNCFHMLFCNCSYCKMWNPLFLSSEFCSKGIWGLLCRNCTTIAFFNCTRSDLGVIMLQLCYVQSSNWIHTMFAICFIYISFQLGLLMGQNSPQTHPNLQLMMWFCHPTPPPHHILIYPPLPTPPAMGCHGSLKGAYYPECNKQTTAARYTCYLWHLH